MTHARCQLFIDSIGTQHLLLGLLTPDDGVGFEALQAAGVRADRVREVAVRRTPASGCLTDEDAESLRTIGIDLGLLRCDDRDINAVLAELDMKPDDLRAATLRMIGRAA